MNDKTQKFKRILKNIDYRSAVLPCIFLLAGIFFIAFPEGMLNILCYILGSLTILAGVVRFCFLFALPQRRRFSEAVIICVIIAVGILLLVAPDLLNGLVCVMFGLMLIVDALLKAEESVAMKKFAVKKWWLGAVVSALCLILGIFIIVNPFTTQILMIFVGIAMLFDAVCSFASIFAKSASELRVRDGVANPAEPDDDGDGNEEEEDYDCEDDDDDDYEDDEEDDSVKGKNIIDI